MFASAHHWAAVQGWPTCAKDTQPRAEYRKFKQSKTANTHPARSTKRCKERRQPVQSRHRRESSAAIKPMRHPRSDQSTRSGSKSRPLNSEHAMWLVVYSIKVCNSLRVSFPKQDGDPKQMRDTNKPAVPSVEPPAASASHACRQFMLANRAWAQAEKASGEDSMPKLFSRFSAACVTPASFNKAVHN